MNGKGAHPDRPADARSLRRQDSERIRRPPSLHIVVELDASLRTYLDADTEADQEQLENYIGREQPLDTLVTLAQAIEDKAAWGAQR